MTDTETTDVEAGRTSDLEPIQGWAELPTPDSPPAQDVAGLPHPDEPEAVEEDEVAQDEPGVDREAARYRKRLRQVEQERDTLQTVVNHLRRAELDRIATSGPNGVPRLHDAGDLFGDDFDLSALVDDDGRVDETRVREHIAERTADRPYLRADLGPRPPAPTRSQGVASTASPGARDTGEAWVDLLRGGRR